MFEKLPIKAFEDFHRAFQVETWDICARCGGKCEINKIGTLIPGEGEYIALSLGYDWDRFRGQYLDGILTPFGVVDVLKMKPGCPFLDAHFHCTIKHVKVILCEIYPVVFSVQENEVDFSLDPWCPIVRHKPEISLQFEKAIPAMKRLGAPVDWYRAVELYDYLCVDYQKLFSMRANNLDYIVFSLDQIIECQDEDAPPPELNNLPTYSS